MAKNLVVVESPAKAKTIEKFLGKKNYTVKASVGHIRDLPKSKLGIDIDNNFEPQYITIRGKGEVVSDLKKEAKKADKVFLATDPDREGEAISWHLANLLKIDDKSPVRIEFNEITKEAVTKAIKNPRTINMDIVDAQQARRVIDRLVGYKISPILWSKVRKGLSAGRVQSVATRIIKDREEEIRAFIPEEYWNIELNVQCDDKKTAKFKFIGKKLNDGKVEKIELTSEKETNDILNQIEKKKISVDSIEIKERKRSAPKPFTTSLLQQEAGSKISFATKKTMMVAQQLYEGVEVKGSGTIGLITYIRTDSQRISEEAKEASKEFIMDKFGMDYFKIYENKSSKGKKIQDAHECIRPSYINLTPDEIKDSLTKDQYKLYKLIWERFVACSMSDAVFETQNIVGLIENNVFKANGSVMKFDGFLKVYTYSKSDEVELPKFEINQDYIVKKVSGTQHFTQPPARYTESTLVKILEEKGIGRPSTYAPTIGTILARGYIQKKDNALHLTELGEIVTNIMSESFPGIVDVDFTAGMENELDMVEEGQEAWKDIVARFYPPFEEAVKLAEENLEKIQMEVEETDEICELCGNNMVIRHGRFGKFMACKNYPECKNTKPILNKVGVKCPTCKDGDVIVRKTKKGRDFYGCSTFPECKFVSWNKPNGKECSLCGSYLVEKVLKDDKVELCSNKECPNSKVKKDK